MATLNTGHALYSYIKFYGEADFPQDDAGVYGARSSGSPSTTTGGYGTAVTSQVTFTNSVSQANVSRTVFVWAKQASLGTSLIYAGAPGVSGWSVTYDASQRLSWVDFGVASNIFTADPKDPWASSGAGSWNCFAIRRDRSGTNDVRWYDSSGLKNTISGSSYNTGSYTINTGSSTNGIARLIVIETLVSESDIISILSNPSQLLSSGSTPSGRNLLLRVG